MLDLAQQNRLEALVTALAWVPKESNSVHAQELIDFLEEINDVNAIRYSVSNAAAHYRIWGETPGTYSFLRWAVSKLGYRVFRQAYYFYKVNKPSN